MGFGSQEIIDQNNYSTCWEDQFGTDKLAFDEAMSAIEEEGILAFVQPTEAEANNIEPYTYLVALFRQLPLAKTVEDFEALLPWQLVEPKTA